ncbi:prolyl oligopeptidase family serine peptidase [Spirosoma sp. HMF4905]|uniref:Prolyl oligopeptidase family serine peptidase n=1 Tax=Spirosoma arboris TaxID=2682092 RepID=A0A7K1SIX0_9BACT|nr:prolyl oligopeptidase family serine peptidase [Spirosoma arboris]MVM33769.1 prolyl oligopeptidase family serine peptidase [Spirosoma arboris]
MRQNTFLASFFLVALNLSISALGQVTSPSLFSYDRQTPLPINESITNRQKDLTIRQISFPSPKGGVVTGILVVPSGKGPFAGVVLAHGLPSSAKAYIPRAAYIARHGAVVVALDAPFARRSGEALTFTPQDSSEQVQIIVDLQRAVDLLIARSDVDANRIGFVGRSYGGTMGVLLSGIESRVKSYILSVADGGLVTHFTDPGSQGETFRSLSKEQQERWRAAMLPLEPIHYLKQLGATKFLFQNGRQDSAIPIANATQLHRAAPDPKTIKWYDTGHDLNVQAYLDQLNWLHETIGTTAAGPTDHDAPVVTPALDHK